MSYRYCTKLLQMYVGHDHDRLRLPYTHRHCVFGSYHDVCITICQSTGPRARANISGCFVMTTGPYAGNCNFNTNKAATCEPPCTLMGSVVRSLCIRK
eukprot:COSAG01_NODE_4776_length_4750_cov_21.200817_2_plen_98_part_00